MTVFHDPRFDALRNALYHTERKTFFDFVNRSLSFLVIVMGATVIGKAVESFHVREAYLEIGVVIVATAQLVFDMGGKARNHEFLQRRYYELLTEMEDVNLDDEAQKRKWSSRLLAISADEPMPMRALDTLAYNKALSTTIDDDNYVRANRLYVTWYQRRLRHIFAFHSAEFPKESTKASS